MWDMKCGAINLVNDYFNNKGNPFKRVVGGHVESDWYEKLRLGALIREKD